VPAARPATISYTCSEAPNAITPPACGYEAPAPPDAATGRSPSPASPAQASRSLRSAQSAALPTSPHERSVAAARQPPSAHRRRWQARPRGCSTARDRSTASAERDRFKRVCRGHHPAPGLPAPVAHPRPTWAPSPAANTPLRPSAIVERLAAEERSLRAISHMSIIGRSSSDLGATDAAAMYFSIAHVQRSGTPPQFTPAGTRPSSWLYQVTAPVRSAAARHHLRMTVFTEVELGYLAGGRQLG
jgi:hypothetical protein